MNNLRIRSLPESTSAPYASLSYSTGLTGSPWRSCVCTRLCWVLGVEPDKVVTVSKDGSEESVVEVAVVGDSDHCADPDVLGQVSRLCK